MSDLFEYAKSLSPGTTEQIGVAEVTRTNRVLSVQLKITGIVTPISVLMAEYKGDGQWITVIDDMTEYGIVDFDHARCRHLEMNIRNRSNRVVEFLQQYHRYDPNLSETPNKIQFSIYDNVRDMFRTFSIKQHGQWNGIYVSVRENSIYSIKWVRSNFFDIPDTTTWMDQDWLHWWMTN
ncbi:MAG: hypothetical protein WC284_14790 [Candidimonas sp.]